MGQGDKGAIALRKFWAVRKLSEYVNFKLVGKFSSKSAKFWAENTILGKFRSKIETEHLCWKFAAVSRNSVQFMSEIRNVC